MTIAKGDPAHPSRTAVPPGARRSHVPNDGSAEAAAVERARKGMLHEGRDLKRTRIGADVLCEALLRQGVDVFFSYPGGVILPFYDILGDYPSSATSWSATSRVARTRPTATHGSPAGSACAWAPPARARPTW